MILFFIICLLFLLYVIFFYKERESMSPNIQELTCRVFEYSRGDVFKAQVIMKGGEFHCFGEQTIPPETPEDVVLAFLHEAQRAAEKRLEKESEEYNGTGV